MVKDIFLAFLSIFILMPEVIAHNLSNNEFNCEKIINRECKFSGEWDQFTRSVPNCNPRQLRGRIGFEVLSCKCNDNEHM